MSANRRETRLARVCQDRFEIGYAHALRLVRAARAAGYSYTVQHEELLHFVAQLLAEERESRT